MIKNIRKEFFFDSAPEEVWEALTNPNEISIWLMSTNDFDPKEGKKFVMQAKPMGSWNGKIYGEVLTVDKPHVLSYTWKGDQMNSTTILKWTLMPVNSGTLLAMEHSGFEGLGDYLLGVFHPMGWNKFLKQLLNYLKDEKR